MNRKELELLEKYNIKSSDLIEFQKSVQGMGIMEWKAKGREFRNKFFIDTDFEAVQIIKIAEIWDD